MLKLLACNLVIKSSNVMQSKAFHKSVSKRPGNPCLSKTFFNSSIKNIKQCLRKPNCHFYGNWAVIFRVIVRNTHLSAHRATFRSF